MMCSKTKDKNATKKRCRIGHNKELHAVETMRKKKAPGLQGIPSKLLILIEEIGMNILVDILNAIYKMGIIPKPVD